jgi:hypothetical protein
MKAPPVVALIGILFLSASLGHAEPEGVEVSRIKRTQVVSSNVASVGYSRSLHVLEIEFVRGAIYRFLNVPAIVYRELLASDSKGHFIAERLRGKYEFVRIRPRRSKGRLPEEVAARSP